MVRGQSYCDYCAADDEGYTCPECGDSGLENFFREDEPIIDCLDHIEDGDVRHEARQMIKALGEEVDRLRRSNRIYRMGVNDLERQARELLGKKEG